MIKPYVTLAERILTSNARRLGFPYKLTYALTYRCNYRCRTCNIWKRPPSPELSLEEIRRFFRKSPGFSWIDLTGGEIFLRKDFVEVVEAILEYSPRLLLLHFPTNGYLTDTIVRSVERIRTWKPEKLIITVSMDGDEAVNDEIRGIRGGWRRQMETFRQLRSIPGVEAVLGMTLSAWNAGGIERTFEAARAAYDRLRYEDLHVNVAQVSGHYYGNEGEDPHQGRASDLIGEIERHIRRRGAPRGPVAFLEREYLKRVPDYLRTHRTPVRCQALRASCFMGPNGDIYPCSMYDRVIGNVAENGGDLRRIWDSEPCRRLQREIWDCRCPHCWTPCEAYQSVLGSLFLRRRGCGSGR